MIAQCKVRCASTRAACTTAASGSTMRADSSPWHVPDSTLAIATSQMGHGAWTRSSISRVNPNSWDIWSATDWTPWNMIEMPTTPATSTVANDDSPPGPDAPTELVDLREDVEEHEAQQERLDHRAQHELPEVLAQHHEVPKQQGTERGAAAANAERLGPDASCGGTVGAPVGSVVLAISRAAPCRSG